MKMKFLNYLSAGVVALGLTACTELEKADYNQTTDPSVLPTVTTGAASNIINSAAIISLEVAADSTVAAIQEVGIVIDTDSTLNPVEGETATFTLNADGTATGVVSGLAPGTTYYYRAYVSTRYGVAFGNIETFGTISDGVNFAEGPGWSVVLDGLGVFGGEQPYCFGSSGLADVDKLLDPSTTQVGIGYDVDNVLTTTVDLAGMVMPSVMVNLIDIDGLMLGMGMPGGVTLYASSSPINNFDDLEGATTLGSYNFTTGGPSSYDATFNIPPQFYGQTCYIAIRCTSSYNTNNLGVFLYDRTPRCVMHMPGSFFVPLQGGPEAFRRVSRRGATCDARCRNVIMSVRVMCGFGGNPRRLFRVSWCRQSLVFPVGAPLVTPGAGTAQRRDALFIPAVRGCGGSAGGYRRPGECLHRF